MTARAASGHATGKPFDHNDLTTYPVIVNCTAIIKDKDRFLREMKKNSPAAQESIDLAYRTRAVALQKLRSLGKK